MKLRLWFITFAALSSTVLAEQQPILEEVVVTAQRKSENLMETPISVTSIGSEKFSEIVATQFDELGKLTSGVQFTKRSRNNSVGIRGVGTEFPSSVPPRVTLYFDQALVQPQDVFTAMFDIERFEILRGPQGTLYGKTSPAGTINVYSRDPSLDEVEGYVQGTAQQRNGLNGQFGISLPLLTNQMAVRFAGVYDRSNDLGTRHIDGDAAEFGNDAWRIKWLYRPTDQLEFKLSLNHLEHNDDNWAQIAGNGLRAKDRKAVEDVKGRNFYRAENYILEVNWSLGDNFQLTSITRDSPFANFQTIDLDNTDSDSGIVYADILVDRRAMEELRLSSIGNEYWDFILGAYYSINDTNSPVTVHTRQLADVLGQQTGVPGINQLLDVNLFLNVISKDDDLAVFMHNSLKITETSELTLGARLAREKLTTDIPVKLSVADARSGVLLQQRDGNAVPENDRERTFNSVTGTLKYQYFLSDTSNVFLTLDRGYRSAAANLNLTGNIPNELVVYDPETSNSVELSYKGEHWDNRLRVTAALYYQQYLNYQAYAKSVKAINDLGNEVTFDAFVNADEVIARGVEFDIAAAISANLRIGSSVSFNQSYYKKFDDAPCNTDKPLSSDNRFNRCDLHGERINSAPQWTGNLEARYTIPLTRIPVNVYMAGLANFSGKRKNLNPPTELNAYPVYDIYAGAEANDNSWQFALFAKNLLDETGQTSTLPNILVPNFAAEGQPAAISDAQMDSGYHVIETIPPRTLGARFTYNF